MKLISDYQIKQILGVSGTDKDSLISYWNETATEMLKEQMMVPQIERHTVTDERIKITNPYIMRVRDYPIDMNETISLKDSYKVAIIGLYFDKDDTDKFTVRFVNSDGVDDPVMYYKVYASYTAGYRIYQDITIADQTSLDGKTITVTVDGTATTKTFVSGTPSTDEIEIGVDEATTAGNFANEIGGTSVGAVVTAPLGTTVSLGTATSTEITFDNIDFPQDLATVIAFIVGGGIAEQNKQGGVTSYSIGNKSVTFSDSATIGSATNQKTLAQSILSKYATGKFRGRSYHA